MPLSKPDPRSHVHTRNIQCQGYKRDDGLWDIEGMMIDTKAYSFENADRGTISSGEPIHKMWLRLTVDDDLLIHAVEAVTDAAPFNMCGGITSAFQALKGLAIGPGWRRAVLQRLGGTKGCTHLTDMLMGPLAVVAYQTVRPPREKPAADGSERKKPAILDTCHAFASDGQVVKRRWPEFYTGE